MIRVVIVDDHAVVRQGLRFLLSQQSDIEVIGECKDGAHAVSMVSSSVPDVVLLDLLMPRMDGLSALREMKRLTPTSQVIVLTSYYQDEQIFSAIKAGALSYLLKDVDPEELVDAVRAAARGEGILHRMVAARVLREMQHLPALQELTPREREVLVFIAHGRSNSEIASQLVIGEGTVKTHVSNILSKLHLADRTQAAIYALQRRLIPLEDALKEET